MHEQTRCIGVTYAESAPAEHLSIISQGQCMAIASGELHNDSSLREACDGGRGALERVETAVASIITPTVAVSNISQAAFPSGVATESALVVDAPSHDFAIMSEGSDMHPTTSDLNNADILGRE